LIGLVLFFNVQCALVFLISPESFAPGFELQGAAGSGMVRGMGILFLMWNVPYAAALIHPVRWRVSLYEAVIMQAIGLAGETFLLATFPPGHPIISETVIRFIVFDGSGLLLLLLALGLIHRIPSESEA
jgi:hypothetical protein